MAPVVRIAFVLSLALLPARAAAQVPLPRVELGGHAGALTSHSHLVTAGPRLTVNFTPETALELAAEFQQQDPDPRIDGFHAAALYHLQLRQQLWNRGRVKVSGLVGAGLGYRDYRLTPVPPRGGGPTPTGEFRDSANALLTGVSTELTVSPRLALRADAQVVFGPLAGVRVVAGASVPVGRFPMWPSRPEASPSSLAHRLAPGQRAWVTLADGREYGGLVRGVDTRAIDLALPESIVSLAMSDVRRIAIPDSIGNGLKWGSLAGGSAMGTLSTIFAVAYCGGGGECGNPVGLVLVTTGIGAGLGAVGGAIIDSFIDGRRVVYESGGGGLGGRIAWGGRR